MPKRKTFDPEGSDYDLDTALDAGMEPAGPEAGENAGHMGSVVSTTSKEKQEFKLPRESYLILKGRKHPTWDKAVDAERKRGFKVIKKGKRYYSVPDRSRKTIMNAL